MSELTMVVPVTEMQALINTCQVAIVNAFTVLALENKGWDVLTDDALAVLRDIVDLEQLGRATPRRYERKFMILRQIAESKKCPDHVFKNLARSIDAVQARIDEHVMRTGQKK